jgi:hypothetical protein
VEAPLSRNPILSTLPASPACTFPPRHHLRRTSRPREVKLCALIDVRHSSGTKLPSPGIGVMYYHFTPSGYGNDPQQESRPSDSGYKQHPCLGKSKRGVVLGWRCHTSIWTAEHKGTSTFVRARGSMPVEPPSFKTLHQILMFTHLHVS